MTSRFLAFLLSFLLAGRRVTVVATGVLLVGRWRRGVSLGVTVSGCDCVSQKNIYITFQWPIQFRIVPSFLRSFVPPFLDDLHSST